MRGVGKSEEELPFQLRCCDALLRKQQEAEFSGDAFHCPIGITSMTGTRTSAILLLTQGPRAKPSQETALAENPSAKPSLNIQQQR